MRALRAVVASIASNKGLACTLVAGFGFVVLLTAGALPGLTEYVELVPLSDGETRLGSDLISLIALDFAICFATEKGFAQLLRSGS